MFSIWFKKLNMDEGTEHFDTLDEVYEFLVSIFSDLCMYEITKGNELISIWDNVRF